jgi:hypothetical protein
MDGGNAFVIWAKNLLRPDFMKSEVPVHMEHYFWEANFGTMEPLELLASKLNVVREDSDGMWRQLQTLLWLSIMLLQMWLCGSLCRGPGVWGIFVSLCAFSRKCPSGAMSGCMVI